MLILPQGVPIILIQKGFTLMFCPKFVCVYFGFRWNFVLATFYMKKSVYVCCSFNYWTDLAVEWRQIKTLDLKIGYRPKFAWEEPSKNLIKNNRRGRKWAQFPSGKDYSGKDLSRSPRWTGTPFETDIRCQNLLIASASAVVAKWVTSI